MTHPSIQTLTGVPAAVCGHPNQPANPSQPRRRAKRPAENVKPATALVQHGASRKTAARPPNGGEKTKVWPIGPPGERMTRTTRATWVPAPPPPPHPLTAQRPARERPHRSVGRLPHRTRCRGIQHGAPNGRASRRSRAAVFRAAFRARRFRVRDGRPSAKAHRGRASATAARRSRRWRQQNTPHRSPSYTRRSR